MDLAERTLELCAIRSPIGEEAEIAAYVARETGGERIGNAVVCGRVTGSSKPAVILAGHLDTVPLQEGDFPARRAEGRIYGRGASDMKGALAVMIELWKNLPKELPLDLVEIYYDKEEGPYLSNGLTPLLQARPDLRNAALALCLEPTDLALQSGCCGSLHATLTFRGRTAHSARPWQGENAIHKAGALLTELAARAPREVRFQELVYREVMSITRIEGFNGRNVVPARCDLNLNYRFAPGRSADDAAAEVEALARKHGAEIAITDKAPSGPVILDNPLIQEFRALTAAPVEAKQAWTDVAQLAQQGIPAANFGPGEQAQAHQRGESCSEEALIKAYQMLHRFITGAAT